MSEERVEYMMTRYKTFHFRCPVCKQFYYGQLCTLYNEYGHVEGFFRIDRDGKSYSVETLRRVKACCGVSLQVRRVVGVYDTNVKCGRKCFDGSTQNCTCSCGGLLHGVSHSKW